MSDRSATDALTPRREEDYFDAWTYADYKQATYRRTGVSSKLAPTWTGEHMRRLTAYNVYRAFAMNAARRLVNRDEVERRNELREYGDANVIVEEIVAALLGDAQEIVVDGAEDFDPDEETPEVPEGEEPPEPDETEAARRLEAQQANDLQEFLRAWAEDDRFQLGLIESETNAVELGDAVYTLGWSTAKGRVKHRVWDPATYFPVFDEFGDDGFPTRVHIAFEIKPKPGEDKKTRIRRITWDLRPITVAADGRGEPQLDEDGTVRLVDGDRFDADGRIVRSYPWNEEPSSVTCYMTDAIFTLDSGRPRDIDDFSAENAEYLTDEDGEIRDRDLMIDFLPVVHVPNTIGGDWGVSSLATVLQILDDLQAADTDISKASAMTGFPPVAVTGASMGEQDAYYGPGHVWNMPAGGSMEVVDTSGSLDALLKYIESLLKRASVNVRLPEAALGRIKPSDVPSGIALRLGFGPLERMVTKMRLIRDVKYPLLLKFVWRMSLAADTETPKEFLPARVAFGSYMPADLADVVERVSKLLTSTPPAVSLETAVQMLVDAGMSIDDAAEEVRRIESRDFKGANELLDATGDEQIVGDYLGVDVAPSTGLPGAPPQVTLPEPAGGTT